MRILYIVLPLVCCLFSCTKIDRANRMLTQMEGEWIIEKSERWSILKDGSTDKFEDLTDAGEIMISPDEAFDLGGTKVIDMSYTNFQGQGFSISTLLVTDEDRTRVILKNLLCNELFECDLYLQIEERSRNTMVWTTHFFVKGGPTHYSRFANPTEADFNTKWTLTLKRQ
ncbi:MAG: hypothetical protein AAFY71_25395 [Bacteroidota bacterium]